MAVKKKQLSWTSR